ncbi:MAG: GNAT family N-acetyltransferase [Pirellulaceae bacterium]|nr:GNAT family N-acetyltransferase [Pirellulaceae bacterium]
MSKFICGRLAKHHDRKAFHCGAVELDEYLRQRAGQDMRRRVAAVFVMAPEDEPTRIAGYYSLASASIALAELPDEIVKRLPCYPVVRAILIGRLARDVGFPGAGKLLLLDALARSLRYTEEVASAVVLVDAKNEQARAFYSRYGFIEVSGVPDRMFLPMNTVERLLKADV